MSPIHYFLQTKKFAKRNTNFRDTDGIIKELDIFNRKRGFLRKRVRFRDRFNLLYVENFGLNLFKECFVYKIPS